MIVKRALDALEAGFEEVLADEPTRLVTGGACGAAAELLATTSLRSGQAVNRQVSPATNGACQ